MKFAKMSGYFPRMPRPKRPLKMPYEGPTTPAQQRVIDDLMLGHTNKDIAVSLGIAEQTVRSHLTHIFIKYGVENRGALILAEHERLERLKCQASTAADNELTPPPTPPQPQGRQAAPIHHSTRLHRPASPAAR